MMVKSLSRKTPDFAGLLSYVAHAGKTAGPPLFHNFPPPPDDGFELTGVQAVFEVNAGHCPARKNGTFLYHEILSLAPADAPQSTPEILLDLARHYLTLRAPAALAYGVVHADRANPHLHLVIAANRIGQAKKLRLSRDDFGSVKRQLEAYQRAHYPELRHSLVCRDEPHPRTERAVPAAGKELVRSPSEYERAKRHAPQAKHAPSRKEHLHELLLNAFTVCDTPEQFTAFLTEHSITLYHRGGRPYGLIADDKKYRFTTLGLEPHLQQALTGWQQLPGFGRAFAEGLAERLRQEWRRETGYAADIADVLHVPNPHPPPDPMERQAQHEIGAAIPAQRQRRRDRYLDGRGHSRNR